MKGRQVELLVSINQAKPHVLFMTLSASREECHGFVTQQVSALQDLDLGTPEAPEHCWQRWVKGEISPPPGCSHSPPRTWQPPLSPGL